MSPNGVSDWTIVVANTRSATTTYLHIGLIPGTTRFYRVAAINGEGAGDYSNVRRGSTNAAPPDQPRNLRALATGPSSITITWQAPASDGGARITGYWIQTRSPNDGTWITIRRNTGSPATTFTHTKLAPATAYRYQVAAINSVGESLWSLEASTTTHPDVPSAPYNLTARAVGTSQIDLSWSAPRNTGGAPVLGYRIEASSDGGTTWRIIRRNTNSTTTRLSDMHLQPATTRHYRVAAINTAGTGPFSNVAQATTEATLPGTPRTLTAEADGTSEIDLSWQAPTTDGGADITGYRVEVSENGGGTWQEPGVQHPQHAHHVLAHRPRRRPPRATTASRRSTGSAWAVRRASRAPPPTRPCPTRPPGWSPPRPHPRRSTSPGSRPPTTAAPRSPATGSRSRRPAPPGPICSPTPGPRAPRSRTPDCFREARASTASRRSTARAPARRRGSLRRRRTIPSNVRDGSTAASCRMWPRR